MMPYNIISKIEDDETLATTREWAATLPNRKLREVFDWGGGTAATLTNKVRSLSQARSDEGKAQSNNSGSDKRELYAIAQVLQKPYHDMLFRPHQIIIRQNKWLGAYPETPFVMLTTLDQHQDAKQINPEDPPTDN